MSKMEAKYKIAPVMLRGAEHNTQEQPANYLILTYFFKHTYLLTVCEFIIHHWINSLLCDFPWGDLDIVCSLQIGHQGQIKEMDPPKYRLVKQSVY